MSILNSPTKTLTPSGCPPVQASIRALEPSCKKGGWVRRDQGEGGEGEGGGGRGKGWEEREEEGGSGEREEGKEGRKRGRGRERRGEEGGKGRTSY